MVIFNKLEQEGRKELISLLEDFIKNPKDPSLEEKSLICEQKYAGVPVLSKKLSFAGGEALKISLNELSLPKAKKLLKSLKDSK